MGIQHEFEVRHEYVGAKRMLGEGSDITPLLSTAIVIARAVSRTLASFMPLPAIAAFANIFKLLSMCGNGGKKKPAYLHLGANSHEVLLLSVHLGQQSTVPVPGDTNI